MNIRLYIAFCNKRTLYICAVCKHSYYILSVIHPWNIYLYVNALWSLLAAIMYSQFPESPKFLLSQDQENKALEILKYVYHINTGNDEESFPVSLNNFNVDLRKCVVACLNMRPTTILYVG